MDFIDCWKTVITASHWSQVDLRECLRWVREISRVLWIWWDSGKGHNCRNVVPQGDCNSSCDCWDQSKEVSLVSGWEHFGRFGECSYKEWSVANEVSQFEVSNKVSVLPNEVFVKWRFSFTKLSFKLNYKWSFSFV